MEDLLHLLGEEWGLRQWETGESNGSEWETDLIRLNGRNGFSGVIEKQMVAGRYSRQRECVSYRRRSGGGRCLVEVFNELLCFRYG